ncbi:ribosomal biogenesis protein Gar2 [Aspergillus sclerotialis]|uniref:Ribosomal biogenesis protein Gar2 n=1 Tax=Aspergillus sclerotialis TaxID=2070753 RepID=A0A3A2ZQV8_9EURO|nr:ribosomal biogenesis protein Gar2 [Aspergillus sclerotialis]
MPADKKDKKRKAAVVSADAPAKKSKKVDPKPSESTNDAPKPILKKKASDSAVAEDKSASKMNVNGKSTREIKPRKRAADFLSDDENSESDAAATEVKGETKKEKPSKKKSKKEDGAAAPVTKDQKSKSDSDKKPKTISKPKKSEAKADASDDDDDDSSVASSSSDDNGEGDQTAALIKGFESSGDEDASEDEGFDPTKPLPKIPDSKKAKRKILKKQKKTDEPQEPGTVYIGRIPHGFYEHQMRAYFSQFGDITRLRLSRNRITGRSKHYAFVEFASVSVAKIVAATMNNYLMYGHILKCKYVPSEQLHPDIWKGANRRFKKTPWNRIEKKRLEKGKTREQWAERIQKEQEKRNAKAEKLKALGYEMELPQLKSVDEIPVREDTKAIEASEAKSNEPTKAIEAPKPKESEKAEQATTDDTPKELKKAKKAERSKEAKEAKKERKESKSTTEENSKKAEGTPVQKEAAPPVDKKAKKAQKEKKGKSKQ